MTTTLKLHELYKLQTELIGVEHPETGDKLLTGLLEENINLVTKYWLNTLSVEVSDKLKASDSIHSELVRKYGMTDENGVTYIPTTIGKDQNPNFVKFSNEFDQVLGTEVEITHFDFKLSDFQNISTSQNIKILYKLVNVNE